MTAGARRGDRILICSDGAARGNPGPAGAGGLAVDPSGDVLVEVCEYLWRATNNAAEYKALILVLERSAGLGFDRVLVRTDSTLVANQVTGGFKVKSAGLRPLVGRVRELLDGYSEVQVEAVPREKNIACDRLANRAIDEGLAGAREPVMVDEEDSLF